MENKPKGVPSTTKPGVIRLKVANFPQGQRPKGTTMARLEAATAFRHRLLTAAALVVALAAGILIGRFLIP
jgi:hypothetical protein